MKTLPLTHVRAGMVLARPLNHHNFLLGKGARLTDGLIIRMEMAGIGYVCVRSPLGALFGF
jgi:hypothetical protein